MFLSTYENKLDKKGRVSVPASFRSHLSNLGYNGVICYPSFNNSSIEACSQDRIEKISSAIDSLNPFEEKRDYFATSILAESINLQFDSEGRISLSSKLLKHAKIKNSMLFVGQGQTFQIWEPTAFEKFKTTKLTLNHPTLIRTQGKIWHGVDNPTNENRTTFQISFNSPYTFEAVAQLFRSGLINVL